MEESALHVIFDWQELTLWRQDLVEQINLELSQVSHGEETTVAGKNIRTLQLNYEDNKNKHYA